MTIRLEAGEYLTQWDKDQRVVMTDAPEGVKVHFASNMDREGAYVVRPYTEDGATYADIPNIVLTHAGIVNVYIYADGRTIYAWHMAVRKREKPADYVYTETELLTWEALDERIKKLEKNTGSGGGILAETDPTVFVWAKSHLPFTVAQLSAMASGAGFVVNPTNFADGKTYFRYHAGATSFTWTNPNPQRGTVTITVLAWAQWGDKTAANAFSALNIVYGDGTTGRLSLVNGQTVTMTTDAGKVLAEIRGNYDHENWVLLDMSVLTIAADYPAPTGTVKSVNDNLPDENGNVQIPIPGGASVMVGATSDADGASGLVPAPAAGDEGKFLAGDGTWKMPASSGGGTDLSLGVTGATVGQIARITAVDDAGVPTAWEAAELPKGDVAEDLEEFELFDEIVTDNAETSVFDFSTNSNGQSLSDKNYKEVFLVSPLAYKSGVAYDGSYAELTAKILINDMYTVEAPTFARENGGVLYYGFLARDGVLEVVLHGRDGDRHASITRAVLVTYGNEIGSDKISKIRFEYFYNTASGVINCFPRIEKIESLVVTINNGYSNKNITFKIIGRA